MAREMYLVGVSEDELKPTPHEPHEPQTPRSWLENVWYHHKVGIIIGLFSLFALGIVIGQIVNRERPDYKIVLTTEASLLPDQVTYLEQVLVPYGKDVNGDGEVVVQIVNLHLGGEGYSHQDTNAQALQMHLISGDVLMHIYEPQYEKRYTAVGRDGAHCFLSRLSLTADGLSDNELSWNWKDDARVKNDAVLSALPKELCFAVRSPKDSDEKSKATYNACVALIEAFATDTKTAN